MSIRQILSTEDIKHISQSNRRYLKRQLKERSILNRMLNKPVNQRILHELQCILDKQPLPRRKAGQVVRGQVSRLSDGNRYPCTVRKMTPEEIVQYGVKEATNGIY